MNTSVHTSTYTVHVYAHNSVYACTFTVHACTSSLKPHSFSTNGNGMPREAEEMAAIHEI